MSSRARLPKQLNVKRFLCQHEISVDKTEFSRHTLDMIKRKIETTAVRSLFNSHPVVGIIGARQVGEDNSRAPDSRAG